MVLSHDPPARLKALSLAIALPVKSWGRSRLAPMLVLAGHGLAV